MVLSKTLQEKWRSPNPTLVGPLTICCNYLQMLRHFYWNKNFPGGVVHYQDLPRGGGSDLLQGICVNYLCRDMNNQLYHPRLTIWSLGQQAPEKRLAEVSGKSIWFLHFIRIVHQSQNCYENVPRPDWYVWGCERGVCWWNCFLLLLSPLQALHPQGYQEAGTIYFFMPCSLDIYFPTLFHLEYHH